MSTLPRLTIDLDALVTNWQTMRRHSGNVEASAVIKADAYGLGIKPVAQALYKAGCKTFFVAMAEEGVTIRKIAPQARIFVLNGIVAETLQLAAEHDLAPVLNAGYGIELWANNPHQGKPENACAIHIDTGMNRTGLSIAEATALADDKSMIEKLNVKLVMSHLACADEPAHPMNMKQLNAFRGIAKRFGDTPKSLANSAGILMGGDYHFDLTRPGIALYGAEAVNNVPNPMKPVVTAEARILQIRQVKKGETIGYGATCTLEHDTKIAVVSAGYSDGFHRSGSGSGVPLRKSSRSAATGAIGKYRFPVIGRVSMDLTAFDVTGVPDNVLENSEWIELFGKKIPVDEAARNCGTIGYEMLTSIGHRYQRTYTGTAS